MTAIEKLTSLGLKPELVTQYESFLETLKKPGVLPDRVVDLCGLRVAAMRGSAKEWLARSHSGTLDGAAVKAVVRGDHDSFTDAEQAALRLSERVSFQWHDLTDEEVDAVVEHFGEPGCVALMTAIAFFDANHRLESALASP